MALLEQGIEGHGLDWWADSIFRALRAAVAVGIAPDAARGYAAASPMSARATIRTSIRPGPAIWKVRSWKRRATLNGRPRCTPRPWPITAGTAGPPWWPTCTRAWRRCLGALGRAGEARDHAEEALRLLERWPGWRRAEAEALRRRLGGGERATTDEVLTPREAEVAALVAEGLSNGDIGRQLYISTKTASVHVSNILAKLGMSSRAEIAAWVARRHPKP